MWFQHVPMMTARRPSFVVTIKAEAVATAVFGGPVLPTRAKGIRTRRDTSTRIPTCRSGARFAYLEPIGADVVLFA